MLDILIKGGMVIDGTGSPWLRADIGVKNGNITAVGKCAEKAARTITAKHFIVTPGFIDVHTHSERIIERPGAENFLRQGITTVVSGNCGDSPLPAAEHLKKVEDSSPAINYALLAGHGSVRRQVMEMSARQPGKKELLGMCRIIEDSMKAGALGVSTGLFYVPGTYAGLGELVEISKAAASYGGIYSTHARSAGGKIFEALGETAAIGRKAGIRVQVSHLKVLHKKGRTGKNRADDVLSALRRFREEGIDITFDLHPYPATFTTLSSVTIPPEVSEGGKLVERLSDRAFRKKIRQRVANNISWVGGPGKITIAHADGSPSMSGKTLSQIASLSGLSASDAAMDLISRGAPRAIFHALKEEEVSRFIMSENAMIASDGGICPGKTLVHPRYFGTFPRVIREFVRERKLLSIEAAVRKMTSFPAGKFGIPDRGVLRPGMKADITAFDPETFSDTATFAKPSSYPAGLKLVLVNGKPAWNGRKAYAGFGKIIRKV